MEYTHDYRHVLERTRRLGARIVLVEPFALIAQAWLRAVTPGDLTAGLTPPARVSAVTQAT
ncbi:hypothetical protein [Micromonospora inositola]|uniref:Uncharacterized protein n=1 Tax=Micromonospora inositola TaxID=47865 RepID=A0A1C5JFR2_9ACTN|nr:hypothetical protein [Micromonospora inositola]SCG69151.1 hypothetical protein GA0070613_4561 [Micromonospora inositola]